MIRHFFRNNDLWLIGAIEMIVGSFILFRFNQLEITLPPEIDWVDDLVPGIIYLLIGAFTTVNAIWDFWWYKIRLLLLLVAVFLFGMLSFCYFADCINSGHWRMDPFVYGAMLIFSLSSIYNEARYKLMGERKIEEVVKRAERIAGDS
ncbi:hypothetical protein [Convivina praedatoris]|uniref:hypothetical protein n=1 Tax=Convivina praedatoris TaxID=2880963 RepID=UPI00200CDEA9|nr:hypothetical protein [Convivina sp. LMG 32447]CAH1856701.1 hypothetical protein R077815_01466 [Convivina sp. LMG 32447]CAH1857098.1 hypothetical protein R078138_01501 [Convivina sp. LMG 32447]